MADSFFFYFFFIFFLFSITPTTNASPILPPHHHLGVASHASPHTQLDAIERFRQYLRIPTVHPNPDYHPAVQFLLSQAASIRFDHTHVVEFVPTKPVLVFTWTGSDPSLPSILLNSHMDVVPVERSKWKYDPFAAVMEENGDIYARGAQDMKCVGMQYLEAIRNLQESGFKPLRTIHVSFVPDEEINSADGFGMFISSSLFKSLNVGVGLDEGGVSESERYNLFIGERIPWDLEIKAVGEPGHGSKLYDNSALENLFKSIEAIMRFRASQFDLIKAGVAKEGEVISVNPVFLKAGTPTPTGFVMNVQPSEAKVGFDIRLPPFTDTEALENRIFEDWAPAARNMTHKYVNKVDIHKRSSITPVDETNPWFGLLVESVSRGGGKLASPEIFRATTDARFVRDVGIPAFGMSPVANTTSRAHSHNEYINAWQFLKGITVYEEILKGFSSFNDRSCSLAYCKVLGNRAYLQESH